MEKNFLVIGGGVNGLSTGICLLEDGWKVTIYSSEFSANMKFGEELKFNNNYIKFVNLETSQSKNYRTLITSFEIKDDKGKIIRLNPEVRIYNQPEILTSEADIKSNLFTYKFLVVNLLKDVLHFFYMY